jgi:Zn-dependent M28 family amino/carboxypeptidase
MLSMNNAHSHYPPHITTTHPSLNAPKATRIVLVLAFVGSGLLAGCGRRVGLLFDGEAAFALATQQMRFGARVPGSEAHVQGGEWIAAQLESTGWSVEIGSFEYRGVALRNIVGRSGDSAAGPILLGAHYDTRPRADRDLVDPSAPVPGANDGASGVAVLLELARTLPAQLSGQEVWLVFFDGEDSGGLDGWDWSAGSAAFAAGLQETPQAVVVVDMVGDSDLQLPRERNSDPLLASQIWSVARQQGATAFSDDVGPSIVDDHIPFLNRGIPAVDIIDFDYPYYHTTADTLDKISPASLEQVGRVLEAWVLSRP